VLGDDLKCAKSLRLGLKFAQKYFVCSEMFCVLRDGLCAQRCFVCSEMVCVLRDGFCAQRVYRIAF
jgi:hypothetical protein